MVDSIRLKGIVDDDFINYKNPSMFLITCFCDFKCCKEQGLDISICQNCGLKNHKEKEYRYSDIYNYFISNNITKAIVLGGMEPFLQSTEVLGLIQYFREKNCDCDFIIYTGYYKKELEDVIEELKRYRNIIIKYGRFVPNQKPHYDEVLGINLVSDNQYAERIC